MSSAKEEIRKLNEQIISLKLEQETTNNKMKKTLDETEDLKKEYQTQIKLLSEANDTIIKQFKELKALNLQRQLKNKNTSKRKRPTYIRKRAFRSINKRLQKKQR